MFGNDSETPPAAHRTYPAKSYDDMVSEYRTLMSNRAAWTEYNIMRAKALYFDLQRFHACKWEEFPDEADKADNALAILGKQIGIAEGR